MSNQTKIIDILNPQAQTIRETVVDENKEIVSSNLFESKPGRKMDLMEASSLSEFPVLLRDGIRSITFEYYAQQPTTYQDWCMVIPSEKPSEDWVEENAIGELPIVPENGPYPEFRQDLDRTVSIPNYKHGGFIAVTEEMIRFNRTNLIKMQAQKEGRAAANTREQAAMSVINSTGNYNRTTADNDIGNNTNATAFSAVGLNLALNTLRTMKDRKSGSYFGVTPNTLIVGPYLEMAAKQLLMAPYLQIPGNGVTNNATIYGTGGGVNPFRGLVNQIIVSPRFATSFQWCLMEAKRAVVFQVVDDLQLLQEGPGNVQHEGYFKYDNVRFRVRDWWGVGMLNDRFAYYSSSASAPSVA